MNQHATLKLDGERYRYINDLGEGATAKVDCVFDKHLHRAVAQKNFNPELSQNPVLYETFLNEARLVGYLNHPGIVPIYGLSSEDNHKLAYTMPILAGASLSDLMQSDPITGDGQALSFDQALSILIKLCETVGYAHNKGVIHLDLKPDNINIGEYGEVFVMDWGAGRLKDKKKYPPEIAKLMPTAVESANHSEADDLFLGTPKYMSPEQTTEPRNHLTEQSDIFSLGIIAYQMFSGRHPFHAQDLQSLMTTIQTQPVPRLDSINPILPPKLSDTIDSMLRKSTQERAQHINGVVKELYALRTSGTSFKVKQYAAGEVIFNQGEPSTYAFTLLAGQIKVSIEIEGAVKTMNILDPGDIAGELGVITGEPRTATLTALTPVKIHVMRKAELDAEFEKLSPWVGKIVESLATRFNEINRSLAKTKTR